MVGLPSLGLFLELEPGKIQVGKPENQSIQPDSDQVHGKQNQAWLQQKQAVADEPEGFRLSKNSRCLLRPKSQRKSGPVIV